MTGTANDLNIQQAGIVSFDGAGIFIGSTVTQYDVLAGATNNGVVSISNGSTGQVLTAQTGNYPTWQSLPSSSISITGNSGGALSGNSFVFTGGTTGLTFAGTSSPNTETLGGTLAIANGGTNATSFTQSNGIVTYNGTRLVNYAGPQISSSGYQTNTTQPNFFAVLSSTQSNQTGDGTTYTLIADTAISNQSSSYNVSTGVFTAPVDGIYSFAAGVSLSGLDNTFTNCALVFLYNAQNIYCFSQNPGPINVGGVLIANATVLNYPMSAGDTMALNITVQGGTKTINIVGSASLNNQFTWLSGRLMA